MSADSNAKALRNFIAQNASGQEMRQLGIYQFVKYDRPETDSPAEMCLACFRYTSINQNNGGWNGIQCVLTGIIGYLLQVTDKKPSTADMSYLKTLLGEVPLNDARLQAWFEQVF